VYSVSPSAPPDRLSCELNFPSWLALLVCFCRYQSGLSLDSLCYTIIAAEGFADISLLDPKGEITLGGSTKFVESFKVFSFVYLCYREEFPDFDFVFSILKLNLNQI
jgi:hypothetical protein